MSDVTYTLECIDSKYDAENSVLINYVKIRETGEHKIIPYEKRDFTNKGVPATDEDMISLSKSFKGKPYTQVFKDDPNIVTITPENQEKYVKEFTKTISDELDKVAEGLSDPQQIIQRKLGNLQSEGKINAIEMLRKEQEIRSNIGDSNV